MILYDKNKKLLDLICNGFTLRRDDPSQKDLFIQLIDFDEPENNLFNIVNQLEVQGREQLRIPDGANTKMGSLFSPYEFFYAWRKVESTDKDVDGISSLMTMVNGLFRMDRLVSVIKDFVYFPDSTDKETKIVCRYPQYFAATKLFNSIKEAMKPNGNGKGGIYFGATGCGKRFC